MPGCSFFVLVQSTHFNRNSAVDCKVRRNIAIGLVYDVDKAAALEVLENNLLGMIHLNRGLAA
jgi:hypothetical protein